MARESRALAARADLGEDLLRELEETYGPTRSSSALLLIERVGRELGEAAVASLAGASRGDLTDFVGRLGRAVDAHIAARGPDSCAKLRGHANQLAALHRSVRRGARG